MATYDVAVVGGGPAGSTCARALVAGGARVVVIDRAAFPRVKLCAGWLSAGIWDALELAPSAYPHGLWEWRTCHVHYRGHAHAIAGRGWFIRRYELDHFLLRRSGAELRLGVHVKHLARDADDDRWVLELPDGAAIHARYLVGAGGTNCPVARLLAPARPRRALGVQELELQTDPEAIRATRIGRDGEPELVLFDDVGGYGWSVAKSDWLNLGCGTVDASAVHAAWAHTHAHLAALGHVPPALAAEPPHLKGHAYFLYEPVHLERAARDRAVLVGDALGLAHPLTGEGILPATVSGRVAAEAILADDTTGYPARLASDPVLADYRRVHRLIAAARALRRSGSLHPAAEPGTADPAAPGPAAPGPAASGPGSAPRASFGARLGRRAVAHGFGWMFSGARLPVPRLLDRVLPLLPGGR